MNLLSHGSEVSELQPLFSPISDAERIAGDLCLAGTPLGRWWHCRSCSRAARAGRVHRGSHTGLGRLLQSLPVPPPSRCHPAQVTGPSGLREVYRSASACLTGPREDRPGAPRCSGLGTGRRRSGAGPVSLAGGGGPPGRPPASFYLRSFALTLKPDFWEETGSRGPRDREMALRGWDCLRPGVLQGCADLQTGASTSLLGFWK